MLDARSEARLQGVNPRLVAVIRRASEISPIPFIVTEGLRSQQRQAELVKAGASRTMNSRHLTGHAVDIAPMVGGQVRWDWPLFLQLAQFVGQAAKDLDTAVVWGGTWALLEARAYAASELHTRFPDGPHFELSSVRSA